VGALHVTSFVYGAEEIASKGGKFETCSGNIGPPSKRAISRETKAKEATEKGENVWSWGRGVSKVNLASEGE